MEVQILKVHSNIEYINVQTHSLLFPTNTVHNYACTYYIFHCAYLFNFYLIAVGPVMRIFFDIKTLSLRMAFQDFS